MSTPTEDKHANDEQFVPFGHMTDQQQEEHLRQVHGFRAPSAARSLRTRIHEDLHRWTDLGELAAGPCWPHAGIPHTHRNPRSAPMPDVSPLEVPVHVDFAGMAAQLRAAADALDPQPESSEKAKAWKEYLASPTSDELNALRRERDDARWQLELTRKLHDDDMAALRAKCRAQIVEIAELNAEISDVKHQASIAQAPREYHITINTSGAELPVDKLVAAMKETRRV